MTNRSKYWYVTKQRKDYCKNYENVSYHCFGYRLKTNTLYKKPAGWEYQKHKIVHQILRLKPTTRDEVMVALATKSTATLEQMEFIKKNLPDWEVSMDDILMLAE